MTTEVTVAPPSAPAGGQVVDLTDAAKAEIAQLTRRAATEHKAGNLTAVEKTLNAILEIDPQHAESLFNLAILARDRKEISNGERLFRRAIRSDPLRIDAYLGLGELLFGARHLMLAIATFHKGLELAPTSVPLLSSLARCYLQLRKPKPVAEYCRRLLAIFPEETEALWCLAWAEYMLGEYREALAILDRLDRASPDNVRGWVIRQLTLEGLGETEAAEKLRADFTEKALSDWIYVKTIVEVYNWSGHETRGYDFVRRFIERSPDSADAFRELSALQMNDGLFHEVQESLDTVLRLQPDSHYVRMVSALSGFRLGDYEEFFRHHESRWGRDTHEGKWDLPLPVWDGAPLADKALLVYSEQGIGDHVMYAGFFQELRNKAKRITIDTSFRLFGLFQRSFPDMGLVDRNQLPPNWSHQEFGAISPYGDLPQMLDSDFEHLPDRDGYLVPDPALVLELRRRYQEMFPGKKLVGISWRSGNRDSAVIRSVDLPHWKPILEVPGYAFVSLQYGAIENDLADLKAELGIEVYRDPEIDAMSLMDPFAAQLGAMDLVISADNSTVHFAGAIGVPCWLMLPVNSDWRWQLGSEDSVWYSSLVLFRSKREQGGDWGPVIAAITDRLATMDAGALATARAAWLLRCMETMDRYGRIADAEQFGRQLLELDTHVGEALRVIATAALRAGITADAVDILARAAALRPGDTRILSSLVMALDANGQVQQAERLGRDALRQAEGDIYLLRAMGSILRRQARHDEALDYFARILRLHPEDIEARRSLAGLQLLEGEAELAQINLEKALSFDSNAAAVHSDLAEILLRSPQPRSDAWEHYRWRFAERPGEMPRHLAMVDPDLRPDVWAGGKLRRQRLMLRAERTIFEQLMFMGRLTEIVGTAKPILLELDPRLLPMVPRPTRKMDLRAAGTTTPEAIIADRIQLVASLGDLAALASDDLAAGRGQPVQPVLVPDPALVAQYRQSYQAITPGRRLVGLSWREPGAPGGLVLLLQQILPVLASAEIGVVLLQSDLAPTEHAALSQITGYELARLNLSSQLNPEDLAAQLAALDIVVSAEELIAHVAAACGVKTVKLCGRLSHWAWGDRSGRCLWYRDASSIHLRSAEDIPLLTESIVALSGAVESRH